MQITVNNDFSNGPRPFTQQEIDSFLQDEQIAVNILNSTFTNNISLTFNVGFGSFEGKPMAPRDGGFGDVNIRTAVGLPYSQLRANLLTFGQPGFFNAANLPDGDSINGISDFWVSSSVAAAFGLAAPNRPPDAPDGFIGINIGALAPGAQRITAFCTNSGTPWAASRTTSMPIPKASYPRSWTWCALSARQPTVRRRRPRAS